MDNINQENVAKTESNKEKLLLYVVPSQKNSGKIILQGEGPALGIIPITESNDCRWGCIDIDEYNFDHLSLIKSIRSNKLPLIVCRSKSGGAHVFLFTKENIPASLMQSKLKSMAIILGYEGSEIFPKQTEILVDRGDTGNFLNLPYYNEMKGLRYAINDTGASCTLEEFFELHECLCVHKRTSRSD